MYERVGTCTPFLLDDVLFDMYWVASGYGYGEAIPPLEDPVWEMFKDCLQGEWRKVMMVLIKPSGSIRLHRDEPLLEGVKRWHVVLQTNDHCWCLHDGIMQRLEQGGIYEIDPAAEHASINWGETERIHLVVDLIPSHVFTTVSV